MTFQNKKDLTFGNAVEAIKEGFKIAREGWNGKNMFVFLVPGQMVLAQTEAAQAYFGAQLIPYNPSMVIKNVDNTVSSWVPSVNDVLSEDWFIFEKQE